MDLLREIFGHKCYMCHKIIQKGNSAGIRQGKGYICVDCIIKPQSNCGNLGYPPMSELKWWLYHKFD